MKKQLITLTSVMLLATAACFVQDMNAATGAIAVDVKAIIGVQTCLGGGSCNQSQSLNAIGDAFDADVKTSSFTDLGTVTSTTMKNLQVPTSVGGKTLYKFTSQGGKTTFLGMEMKPAPRRGTRYYTITEKGTELVAGKDFNIVELYVFNDGKNEWLRNNIIFVEAGKTQDVLPVDLNPDGTINANLVGQAS